MLRAGQLQRGKFKNGSSCDGGQIADSKGRAQGSPPCRNTAPSAAPSVPRIRSRYYGSALAVCPIRPTGGPQWGWKFPTPASGLAWSTKGGPGILFNAVFVGGRVDSVVPGVVHGLVSQHLRLESPPRR